MRLFDGRIFLFLKLRKIQFSAPQLFFDECMRYKFSNFDPKAPKMPPHLLYPKSLDGEAFIQRARKTKILSKVERAKEVIANKTNDEISSMLKEVIRMSHTYRMSDLKKEYELDRSPVIALQRYKDSIPSEKLKEKEWAGYFAVLALHLLDRWITCYEDRKKIPRLQMPQHCVFRPIVSTDSGGIVSSDSGAS